MTINAFLDIQAVTDAFRFYRGYFPIGKKCYSVTVSGWLPLGQYKFSHFDACYFCWPKLLESYFLFQCFHVIRVCYDVHIASLTHWGRETHICVSKQTIIVSDNGLSPGRRQAIIWTNAGILLIRPLGTNFSEISFGIHTFSFRKMQLKMSSGKWRPFCLGLNVLSCLTGL